MSFTRRSFLLGTGAGASLLVLSACTDEAPIPSPSPVPVRLAPEPTALVRSNWSTDPFSRGSTSYLAPGDLTQHRETLATSISDRLFFAGEATADAPSTVRGARDSGARAASDVYRISDSGERIAIIGAGAAGAECARRLSLIGRDVVVLEARDRLGGRIHTIEGPEGATSELGAWRLNDAEDSELLAELSRAGVSIAPLRGATVIRDAASGGDYLVPAAEAGSKPEPANSVGATAVSTAVTWAANQLTDSTLSDALETSGALAEAATAKKGDLSGDQLLEQYLDTIAVATGASASSLSAWFLPPLTSGPDHIVTGSFSSLISTDLGTAETYLSTVVASISYDDDGVSLRLGTGESLAVDRVVITVPLGVLKSGSLEFDPLLPLAHRAAIDGISIGHVEVVKVSFDEAFWGTDAVSWSLTGTDELITEWINLTPVTGEMALVGMVGGENALAVSELDDDALKSAIRASLAPFDESD